MNFQLKVNFKIKAVDKERSLSDLPSPYNSPVNTTLNSDTFYKCTENN